MSVSDFRSIFAGCFGGDTTLPHESPELTDALNCLSKVCLESTVKKSVVHDSSQVFTPEMIYSLQTVVCIIAIVSFPCDYSFSGFLLIFNYCYKSCRLVELLILALLIMNGELRA